jgi:hypothetical protein
VKPASVGRFVRGLAVCIAYLGGSVEALKVFRLRV